MSRIKDVLDKTTQGCVTIEFFSCEMVSGFCCGWFSFYDFLIKGSVKFHPRPLASLELWPRNRGVEKSISGSAKF